MLSDYDSSEQDPLPSTPTKKSKIEQGAPGTPAKKLKKMMPESPRTEVLKPPLSVTRPRRK